MKKRLAFPAERTNPTEYFSGAVADLMVGVYRSQRDGELLWSFPNDQPGVLITRHGAVLWVKAQYNLTEEDRWERIGNSETKITDLELDLK